MKRSRLRSSFGVPSRMTQSARSHTGLKFLVLGLRFQNGLSHGTLDCDTEALNHGLYD